MIETAARAARPLLRGWSHVLAFVAAVVLCPILIIAASGIRAAAAIFAAGVVGLFGVSAVYHRVAWGTRAHELFRRADHAMIFVTIAATYTPIAIASLSGWAEVAILAVVWAGAGVGALIQVAFRVVPRRFTVASYTFVGWVAMVFIVDLWRALGVAGFILVLLGGLLHTAGAVIYGLQRPNPWPRWFGFHELFHVMVVAAVALHYVAIGVIAVRQA